MPACDDSGMTASAPPSPSTWEALPLFPLGTVVFPGALLPLQVFELRYLHMVGACEREQRPFGVVTLTAGGEVHRPGGSPDRFEAMGTLMRLEKVSRPRPGLVHIQCRASERFEIEQAEQRSDGLWVAQVRTLPPEPPVPVPEHLAYLSRQMTDALRKLTAQPLERQPWPEPWQPDDCAWLSHRWGELLPLPTELKYRLFALREPLLRLELVGDWVSPETLAG